jgi:hypothetical protein
MPRNWLDRDGPILLPEGQSDVLSLTAICLSAVGRPSNTGGIKYLAELLRDKPTNRQIIVLAELDPNKRGQWPGKDGAVKTAGELTAKLGRPVSWALPPDGKKDVREWILSKRPDPACADAWHDLGEIFLEGLTLLDASPGNHASTNLPRIDASDVDLAVITERAWQAIRGANAPPFLFRYGAVPSRIESDDEDAPLLRPMTIDRMRHRLARVADWYRLDKKGREHPIAPPLSIVRDVLATPDPDLPVLTRIVEAPIFAKYGALCIEPGYHDIGKIYYAPAPGFNVPKVSDKPTFAECEEAKNLLTFELIGDFPFIGDAEKAHAVAVALGPFVRNMIDGPTPMHCIEAPSPGSGKTLLAELLTYPVLGRPIPAMTEGQNEDEWRKRIYAKLRTAPTTLFLDNIKRRLESAALASAITSYPLWEDRILGFSEIIRVPVQCTWIMTGNNPALSDEMTRRTIRIRLDSRVDRPWLRKGFRHPNIRGWVISNRSRLVWAALTLIQAWIQAGQPEGNRTLGMFEQWAKIMGGILDVAGVPGFLGNLADFYEKSDAEGSAQRGFVASWWTTHGKKSVAVSELWPLATESGLDLGDKGEQSQKIRLGKRLKEMRDRTFTVKLSDQQVQLRIELSGTDHRANLWSLSEVEGGSDECR